MCGLYPDSFGGIVVSFVCWLVFSWFLLSVVRFCCGDCWGGRLEGFIMRLSVDEYTGFIVTSEVKFGCVCEEFLSIILTR